MDLNFWEFWFLISMICLRYAIVLTIVLGILTLIFRKTGFFKLLLALTILCAIPILYVCGFNLYGSVESLQTRREMDKRIIQLKDTVTIAGILVPAGSKVFLRYDAAVPPSPSLIDPEYVDNIVFSKPTRAGDVLLRDTFSNRHDMYHTWEGTLEGVQQIKGWPCFGKIVFSDEGPQLQIANNIKRWGLPIYTGTTLRIKPSSWEFSVHGGRTFTVYESTKGFFKTEGDSTTELDSI